MPFHFQLGLCLLLAISSCGPTPKSPTDAPVATTEIVTPSVAQEAEKRPNKPTVPTSQQMPEPLPEENSNEGEQETTQAIQGIRAEYARITQLLDAEKLRTSELTFECQDDPGEVQLQRYYEGDELVMMQLTTSIGHGSERATIYLRDNAPFFVFEEESYWTFGGPEMENGANTIDYFTENRYYIESGVVIRHLIKEYAFKSWEDNPEPNEVPNRSQTDGIGEEYYRMPVIPQMIVGNVGC